MEELDLTVLGGMRLEKAQWGGNRLSANFGDGYGAEAVNGAAAGLHRWAIRSGGAWPDESIAGIDIDGDTRFEYFWSFFKRHTTGTTSIFILYWRGKGYHASFVDSSMSVDLMRRTLTIYEMGGVQIRQRRIPGFTEYDADGAFPMPEPPVELVASMLIDADGNAYVDGDGNAFAVQAPA